STGAVISDYDGTLSPIVEDPEEATPVGGVREVLSSLTGAFGVVAIVSGRPLAFLMAQLPDLPPTVGMAGLYGIERRGPDGIVVDPAAEPWANVVHAAADRLRTAVPAGVLVEDKQLAVTVHWRTRPGSAALAEEAARREAASSGLRPQPGKMSIELRPPLDVDKGTAVERLGAGCSAVVYLGDDLGDLPAFALLRRLSAERGTATVSVLVVGAETPAELGEAADVTVEGPEGAVAFLRWLATEAGA
ncbi:MAG TPA: trehalose-phosphatase, partial [Acidimicrobiales bacterium]|nr:trehalose-phosphatase [Acidimicrobiales bacterium]